MDHLSLMVNLAILWFLISLVEKAISWILVVWVFIHDWFFGVRGQS